MAVDTRLADLGVSELDVSRLDEDDEPASRGWRTSPARAARGLLPDARIVEDAEDTVQETFLRAGRRRETFEGGRRSRAWLYRIATNACLDLLATRRPEPATGARCGGGSPTRTGCSTSCPPATRTSLRPSPSRGRRSSWRTSSTSAPRAAPAARADPAGRARRPAKDVADLLGDSVNSVNSALQRARAGMREHLPAERQDWTGGEEDAGTRELVSRFTEASVATDIAGSPPCCATTSAARCRPAGPARRTRRGRGRLARERLRGMQGLRGVATSVNRQPAVAFYQWRQHEDA